MDSLQANCDGKGPTITVVKAENERMAAAYNSEKWVKNGWTSIPKGFLASIVDDSEAIGGYFLQKYAANDRAFVFSRNSWGPYFGRSLSIQDRCDENERSFSILGPHGCGQDGVDPSSLFGVEEFRVQEYEVLRKIRKYLCFNRCHPKPLISPMPRGYETQD
jgi:hypothetical protein